jgi:hypothetical protein
MYQAGCHLRHCADRMYPAPPGLMVPNPYQQQQQLQQAQHRPRVVPVTKRVLSVVNPETNKPVELGAMRWHDCCHSFMPKACSGLVLRPLIFLQLPHPASQQMAHRRARAVPLPKKPGLCLLSLWMPARALAQLSPQPFQSHPLSLSKPPSRTW